MSLYFPASLPSLRLFFICVFAFGPRLCISQTASMVIRNAVVYTVNKKQPLAEAVAVQFSIVTIACIVEELEDAPRSVTAFGQWVGGMWLGVVLWPAMWSIAIAAAGSQAHALYLCAWEA